jgi:hypothetical protein
MVRNSNKFGTNQLASSFATMLTTHLPGSWRTDLVAPRAAGAVLALTTPDRKTTEVFVGTRQRIEPKDVPSVVSLTTAAAAGRPVCVSTTFLSPMTQERLREAGVSYADEYGNLRFTLDKPAVFIETTGETKGPKQRDRALASLKGRAAGRVVRALCDFKPPYGVRELAERSETALGSVSRVIELLDQESLVERDDRGRVNVVDWARLIRRWTQDYALTTSNETKNFLEPRGLKALNQKLRTFAGRYAVTGSLALEGKPVIAPAALGVVYVDDVEAVAKKFGLHTVDAGANVILACPFDPVVYDRSELIAGVRMAGASQVAADLLTSPGRGPAEGEELIKWMEKNVDAWRS